MVIHKCNMFHLYITHIYPQTHSLTYLCMCTHTPLVFPLSSIGLVAFKKGRDRISKTKPPHYQGTPGLLSGHGAAIWKPKDQYDSSSSMHPGIVVPYLSVLKPGSNTCRGSNICRVVQQNERNKRLGPFKCSC